jgi:hypothetical protein
MPLAAHVLANEGLWLRDLQDGAARQTHQIQRPIQAGLDVRHDAEIRAEQDLFTSVAKSSRARLSATVSLSRRSLNTKRVRSPFRRNL